MTIETSTPLRKRGRPKKATSLNAAERMRRMRERRKAAGYRSVSQWVAQRLSATPYSSHRIAEARSLAMHVVIAKKIERDPTLLEVPRHNLERWRAQWPDKPPPWWREWRALLQRPWPEIAALITEPSENAARLRQSTPFAGVLTDAERARIYEAFGS
jgi:hypothetical protein